MIDASSRHLTSATGTRIVRASPIPGATRADGVNRGWTDPHALLRVDLFLEADEPARIAAIATLLDWWAEARARGEPGGPIGGRLVDELNGPTVGVRSLLGEICQAWSLPSEATFARLVELREATPERAPPPDAPPMPAPPQTSVELPWEAGTLDLGRFAFGDEVTLLEGGFPGIGNAPVDVAVIGTQPGLWHARLVMEASPSRVTQELLDSEDPVVWLIITRDPGDPLHAAWSTVIPDVGELGKITLTTGTPTPQQIASIRHAPRAYLDGWPWGITWSRPRHPAPVVLGGPTGARTWIALPDLVSA